MRPVSLCLYTWEMQSVARCLAWVLLTFDNRLKNFSRPVPTIIWQLEFAIGRPTPSKGHRVYEILWNLPQWARASQTCTLSRFHLQSTDGDSAFFHQ